MSRSMNLQNQEPFLTLEQYVKGRGKNTLRFIRSIFFLTSKIHGIVKNNAVFNELGHKICQMIISCFII